MKLGPPGVQRGLLQHRVAVAAGSRGSNRTHRGTPINADPVSITIQSDGLRW